MAYQQPPGYSPYPPGQGQYQPPPPNPGYQPAPYQYPPPAQQQQTSNVVVVQQQQPRQIHTTTYVHDDRPNHLLHCIITFFCPWWIFIWLIVCCVYGC